MATKKEKKKSFKKEQDVLSGEQEIRLRALKSFIPVTNGNFLYKKGYGINLNIFLIGQTATEIDNREELLS
jgi:hypothetical protein